MTACIICKNGEVVPGETTVTLQRRQTTIILKGVPADVCDNCGEFYLSESVARRVFEVADSAVRSGAEVEIVRFAA
ncbi:MAG: type II toxin-antitoxin system MqsA family antitoxin [Deltaproteobacteria bacterium]|nr:type II toxin-antitoxin system MqsA family antitoxin [Deltaproteobacteria bacterium]